MRFGINGEAETSTHARKQLTSSSSLTPSRSRSCWRCHRVVRSFADAGNRNDLEAFDTLLAPDFVRHCEATPEVSVTTRDDFKRFYRETARTFPDQRMTISTLVAEGDRVAFWGSFSGTQEGSMGPFPPTGRRMESQIAGMFRIESGRSPITA